jgi:integrase
VGCVDLVESCGSGSAYAARADKRTRQAAVSRDGAVTSCASRTAGLFVPKPSHRAYRQLCNAQGTPLHVVSEVLGHASIAITKDVYGHLLEGDKRAAAESMSRALFGG